MGHPRVPAATGTGRAKALEDIPSEELARRYGRGYFYGENSGYPGSGYESAYPDWKGWLELIQAVCPRGTLVDLGCAYGYLVKEARQKGYQAWGLDISEYALSRLQPLRPFLVRAHLQALPLADDCAHVVTLFDVLEHLADPLQALEEAVRVLKGEGLLVGATPDPLFFPGKEETHCFERPPSFWIQALRDLGLQVSFRFSVEPYNFQFLAAPAGTPTAERLRAFRHDYFGEEEDLTRVSGPLWAVPRHGWGPRTAAGRKLEQSPALVYLLNLSGSPQQLSLRIQVSHEPRFSTLRIRLDSQVLFELPLTSEKLEHVLTLDRVFLPEGGHHLFFEVYPGGPAVIVQAIHLEASPADRSALTLQLPFDLYQRYRLAAQVAEVLKPASILDVGGLLGDRDGHLALSRDFLGGGNGGVEVATTDLRHCDDPWHQPAEAWRQPFAQESYELVVSLDVLEHLPASRRPDFLQELDRVSSRWILLAAPFQSPEVEEAEEFLIRSLLASRSFLQEHRKLGLPRLEEVLAYFREERGYQVLVLPNGYLSRWQAMQILSHFYFSLNDARTSQDFNRLYNRFCFPYDQAEPAYRHHLVVAKQPLREEQVERLCRLASEQAEPAGSSWAGLLFTHPEFLALQERVRRLLEERSRALTDLQFLLNERHKLIDQKDRQIEELYRELMETPLWKLAHRRRKARSAAKDRPKGP